LYREKSGNPASSCESSAGNGSIGKVFAHRVTRDQCFEFLNIFTETIGEKIGVFDSKQGEIVRKLNHYIGF
jgi:hypothetical protein